MCYSRRSHMDAHHSSGERLARERTCMHVSACKTACHGREWRGDQIASYLKTEDGSIARSGVKACSVSFMCGTGHSLLRMRVLNWK